MKDLQIAQRIADTLADYRSTPVLEIGPGMGVLTQFLLEAGHDLTVVELDMESVAYLEVNFPDLKGRILPADFLKLDLAKVFKGDFCVIGIPTTFRARSSSRCWSTRIAFPAAQACCKKRWPNDWRLAPVVRHTAY